MRTSLLTRGGRLLALIQDDIVVQKLQVVTVIRSMPHSSGLVLLREIDHTPHLCGPDLSTPQVGELTFVVGEPTTLLYWT